MCNGDASKVCKRIKGDPRTLSASDKLRATCSTHPILLDSPCKNGVFRLCPPARWGRRRRLCLEKSVLQSAKLSLRRLWRGNHAGCGISHGCVTPVACGHGKGVTVRPTTPRGRVRGPNTGGLGGIGAIVPPHSNHRGAAWLLNVGEGGRRRGGG